MAYTVGSASVDIVPDFKNAQIAITRFFNSQQNELHIPAKIDIDKDGARIEREARQVGERVGKAINEGTAKNDDIAVRQAMKTAETIAKERLKVEREANAVRQREEERVRREEEQFAVRSGKATMKAVEKAMADEAKNNKVQIEIDRDNATKQGRELGGLVTRATREEIHQNAGLIAAATAAALAAGAPVVLAGVVGLFAGAGAAGAFQSQKLRATWIGLWSDIKSAAIADSAVLVPVFSRMAGAIGQTFEQLRPQLRDAFSAVGPQIESLSTSVMQTATIVFPALTRAVQNSAPVIDGLGSLLEKTGTGLGDFLDRITAHAPAAGSVFSELGDAMAVLLPIVGELVGQGAELASGVLPGITDALGGLLSVVDAVSSVLPQIGAGFLYFRLAQGAGRWISNLGKSLSEAAAQGGAFAGVQGRMGSAMSKVGGALPILGAAFAAYGAVVEENQQQIQSYTQVLLRGGAEADRLSAALEHYGGNLGDRLREAQEQAKQILDSMTPLERAQHDLGVATRNLQQGMADEGTTARELADLKGEVAKAAARQRAEEEKLERATEGVTEAMAAQADQARSRVDADFGYQQSVQDVAEAQQKLGEVMADTEASAVDQQKAVLDLSEAYEKQVVAAGDLAKSKLPAAMSDQQKAIIGAKAELDELNKLIAQGVVLPPSLEAYRQQLLGITSQADGATLEQAELATALGEIGVAVESIPDSAAIKIDAPTDEVKQRLLDLGFTVTELPDGKGIKVEAQTAEAKANLGNLSTDLSTLNKTVAKPTADLWTNPFNGQWVVAMNNLSILAGQHPKPLVSLQDDASPGISHISALIAALHDKVVTITTKQVIQAPSVHGVPAGAATGGAIEDVLARAPRYDGGGATYGIGGPTEDLNLIRASPGEHMLDARDVTLMGGQAAVYAFREMLNSGRLGRPARDTGVRQMVAVGAPRSAPAPGHSTRDVTILTSDNPRAIIRAMRAEEQQAAALAPVWPV